MSENTLYFAQFDEAVHDGGAARNQAFFRYYKRKGAEVYNVFEASKVKRIFKLLFVLRVLLLSRKKTLFFHQGTIVFLFPLSLVKLKMVNYLLFSFLQRVANKNRLIIEVNDLPYEQAIDLELPFDNFIEEYQARMYGLRNCYYIFASGEMALYAKTMFNIDDEHAEVIVNGGDRLPETPSVQNLNFPAGKYKCVYAGTLNKGRQVESLISLFHDLPDLCLILLGDWGEWLLEYSLPDNVVYLGNKSNTEARRIVSACDLGLIQYDSSRFYYNLCFPTKVSFYLTAGIPVLSTPLTELMAHFRNSEGVFFLDIDHWPEFLRSLDENSLAKGKVGAVRDSVGYEWSNLLSNSRFLDN